MFHILSARIRLCWQSNPLKGVRDMPDQNTIDKVKATVPLLKGRAEELGTRFYRHLFAEYPELQNVFNHAHQATLKQPRALAESVLGAAENLDNATYLRDAIQTIAHKHRSLEVKPDHYPIVGRVLLQTLAESLGPAATPDTITAWATAYEFIADVFIQAESALYRASQETGGWPGFQPFTVIRKVPESSVITSFYLQPTTAFPLPAFLPGQYVSLRIATPGWTAIRQYSLSSAPRAESYRISVRRDDGSDITPPAKGGLIRPTSAR
ncbi:nitric oxide dioxygenase [Sulfobacillus acidophilus TPY]|nr:nitric oxide dioxygenase [Sulfobacillus acidophilus TPY]